jgi:RNA polymerase sigma-70 factor, ECF subfamily
MKRVAAGDARAFRQVCDEHLPAILRFATRLLQNDTEAHDVAQETFLKVWLKASEYQPKARITTWIHTIARHLSIDRLRLRKARGETLALDSDVDHAPPSVEPGQLLERKWTAERVQMAISALPERQQSALLLRHEQGLSQDDIAQVLDTTVDAVESLLKRARSTLKEQLDHE